MIKSDLAVVEIMVKFNKFTISTVYSTVNKILIYNKYSIQYSKKILIYNKYSIQYSIKILIYNKYSIQYSIKILIYNKYSI